MVRQAISNHILARLAPSDCFRIYDFESVFYAFYISKSSKVHCKGLLSHAPETETLINLMEP